MLFFIFILSNNFSLKFKDELQLSFEKKELGEIICENENEMDFG
jgi:hypothetical protein